jgi:hypothetical protein
MIEKKLGPLFAESAAFENRDPRLGSRVLSWREQHRVANRRAFCYDRLR